jgi:methyl-accepting chemotaxis protein
MSQSLDTFRHAFAKPLMTGQWLLVPVTCAVGWLAGHPALLAIGLVSTLLAAATMLAWRSDGIGLATRVISPPRAPATRSTCTWPSSPRSR